MEYTVIKQWGKRKEGDSITLLDKTVVAKAKELGLIENPKPKAKKK